MHRSDQQTVERFVSTVCGGEFAKRLAEVFAANQVPAGTPKLSIVLENRSILSKSIEEFGCYGAAQRHYAMMSSLVRLIRACERRGAVLIDAGCIPSNEALFQLRQDEKLRRQETSN
jgi:hypothetical protein